MKSKAIHNTALVIIALCLIGGMAEPADIEPTYGFYLYTIARMCTLALSIAIAFISQNNSNEKN